MLDLLNRNLRRYQRLRRWRSGTLRQRFPISSYVSGDIFSKVKSVAASDSLLFAIDARMNHCCKRTVSKDIVTDTVTILLTIFILHINSGKRFEYFPRLLIGNGEERMRRMNQMHSAVVSERLVKKRSRNRR
jgi:hypothetical protein